MTRRVCTYAFILLIGLPLSAQAQFGFGFGGIVFDPKNLAQNVMLYKRTLDQINNQRQQITAQITALRKLARPNWRQIDGLMRQADDLLRRGQALSYNLRTIDAEFARTFPGAAIVPDIALRRESQQRRTLETMRGVMNGTSRIVRDLPDGVNRLSAMKRQMASIRGHEEALEYNGTIDIYSAEGITMLQQQLAMQTNAQAVYFANEVNTRLQAAANDRAFMTWLAAPPKRGRTISYRPDAR